MNFEKKPPLFSLCWEGFCVQGSGKEEGTGCAVTTVGAGRAAGCCLRPRVFAADTGIRCPPARGSWPCQEWALLCRFQDLCPAQHPVPWFPRTVWTSFPASPFLFSLSSLLPASPFSQSLFFFCFYTVITKLKGSCYECLWVLLASDQWADEGFLHRGVNVCLGKGTLKWA